ncbi:MAG TPA: chemotaxis response regulator protein-glutamate methylesterase [Edaphobacter sp.]
MGWMTGVPLRVLAADDSAVMRGVMRSLFLAHSENCANGLPRMELCGVARDGVECLEAMAKLHPDVLVLDLEMPRLDGLSVLKQLRREGSRVPVIMCSSHTEHGARATLEALALGAADYVMKPTGQRDLGSAMGALADQLLPRITALAQASTVAAVVDLKAMKPRRSYEPRAGAQVEIVVIGLSTGGPAALEQLLPKLPGDFPAPVLIVQHMPKLFTGALADRLNKCCALHVEEAYEGADVRAGTIWLAPGDSHMEVIALRGGLGMAARSTLTGKVRLHRRAPLNHCRPSVDYLFHSAAQLYGAGTLALIMTGMGSDGLEGARAVHACGGVVLAQDEMTSAVWGMPGRVAEAGIASAMLPLGMLADELRARVSASRVEGEIAVLSTGRMSSRTEVLHGMH